MRMRAVVTRCTRPVCALCTCRYVQLSGLRPEQLKGTIRIEFVNETGLAEAGIDRTGVFKEFLEDTIARAFDPNRGLFVQTPKQQLCPSPTSELADPHHLRLFEFIGRMLGKSLYEGITLEVPCARTLKVLPYRGHCRTSHSCACLMHTCVCITHALRVHCACTAHSGWPTSSSPNSSASTARSTSCRRSTRRSSPPSISSSGGPAPPRTESFNRANPAHAPLCVR